MSFLRPSRPDTSPFHCDGCGDELTPDLPLATLEVTGPEDRDLTTALGDYCARCWSKLSIAIDTVEQLLDRRDAA